MDVDDEFTHSNEYALSSLLVDQSVVGDRSLPHKNTEQPHSPERAAVLILGMHRSGTSVSTRMVSFCGAELPRNLMKTGNGRVDDGNQKTGFWESETLQELHDEMLQSAGCAWDDAKTVSKAWFESPEAYRFAERLGKAIEQEYGRATLFVVKDPRMCRLVPIWQDVLDRKNIRATSVIVIRNPLEVASSLYRRDQIPRGKSMMMWLHHVMSAERDTRGWERVFVSYEGFLTDWRGTMTRILSTLPIDFPRSVEQIIPEAEAFLESRLRHFSEQAEDLALATDIPEWIRTVFAWCLHAAYGGSPDVEEMDRVYEEIVKAESAFGPYTEELQATWSTHNKRLEAELEERSQRLAALAQRLDEIHWVLIQTRHQHQEQSERLRAIGSRLARGSSVSGKKNPSRWGLSMLVSPLAVLIAKMVLTGRWREPWEWWRGARVIRRSGLFDVDYYLSQCPDVANSGYDPVVHYVAWGAAEFRDPNHAFDTRFYFERHRTLLGPGENPLVHYLRIGAVEGLPTSARFDTAYYRAENRDVAESGLDPLRHYLEVGFWQGRVGVRPLSYGEPPASSK